MNNHLDLIKVFIAVLVRVAIALVGASALAVIVQVAIIAPAVNDVHIRSLNEAQMQYARAMYDSCMVFVYGDRQLCLNGIRLNWRHWYDEDSPGFIWTLVEGEQPKD